jgi:hypothetical protein
MAEIVRVFFRYGGADYCVDKACDPAKDTQGNVDSAFRTFTESMESCKVVPALRLKHGKRDGQGGDHVFVNLGRIDVCELIDAAVYEPKPEEEETPDA